jgi:hypothetical protein
VTHNKHAQSTQRTGTDGPDCSALTGLASRAGVGLFGGDMMPTDPPACSARRAVAGWSRSASMSAVDARAGVLLGDAAAGETGLASCRR